MKGESLAKEEPESKSKVLSIGYLKKELTHRDQIEAAQRTKPCPTSM